MIDMSENVNNDNINTDADAVAPGAPSDTVPAGAQRRVRRPQQQQVTEPEPRERVGVEPKAKVEAPVSGITDVQYAQAQRANTAAEMERFRLGAGGIDRGELSDYDADMAVELMKEYPDVHSALIMGFARKGLSRSKIMAQCEMIRGSNRRGQKASENIEKVTYGPGGANQFPAPPAHAHFGAPVQMDPMASYERMAGAMSKVAPAAQESMSDVFMKMFMMQMMDKQNQPPPWWMQQMQSQSQAQNNNSNSSSNNDPANRIEDMVYDMMVMKMAAQFAGDGESQLTARKLEETVKQLLDEKQRSEYQIKQAEMEKKLDAVLAGQQAPSAMAADGSSVGVSGNKVTIDMDNPAAVADFIAVEGTKAWNRFNAVRSIGGLPQIDPNTIAEMAHSEQYAPDKIEAYIKKMGWEVKKPPSTFEEIKQYVDTRAKEIALADYKKGEQNKEMLQTGMNFVVSFTDNLFSQLAKGKGESVGIKLKSLMWGNKTRGTDPTGGAGGGGGQPDDIGGR